MSNDDVRTIASLERLALSRNGNPRFRVTFTDGTQAFTRPDAAINFSIENAEFRAATVAVTFGQAGHIIGLEVIDSPRGYAGLTII